MRGAREHNLKDVTVAFPRDRRLVVIAGLSGSGKSSLAFDTIYAEGQRQYVESLSAYAWQFLGQMEKPDVDQIDGLSPAVSIDRRGASRNRGRPSAPLRRSRPSPAAVRPDRHPALPERARHRAPERPADRRPGAGSPGRHPAARPRASHQGPQDRRRPDRRRGPAAGLCPCPASTRSSTTSPRPTLDKYKRHSIEVIVDRYRPPRRGARGREARRRRPASRSRRGQVIPDPDASRLADSIETALRLGEGVVLIAPRRATTSRRHVEERRYSEKYSCPYDGFTFDELEPRSFSFNSPHGACPSCAGLGTKLEIDPALLIPNPEKSLAKGGARGRRAAVDRRRGG